MIAANQGADHVFPKSVGIFTAVMLDHEAIQLRVGSVSDPLVDEAGEERRGDDELTHFASNAADGLAAIVSSSRTALLLELADIVRIATSMSR
jgi:hypothetical protein